MQVLLLLNQETAYVSQLYFSFICFAIFIPNQLLQQKVNLIIFMKSNSGRKQKINIILSHPPKFRKEKFRANSF